VSVTAARGFVAHGVAAGIKETGDLDLSLVATADGRPVPAAGVFTRNLVLAAPVTVTRSHLEASGGQAAGVILNSGNANACTGDDGEASAESMCSLVAKEIGAEPHDLLVCSTGLIGPRLPIEKIADAIPELAAGRSAEPAGALAAATAIMTTDTRAKQTVVRRGDFVVGGMAKGAAMLAPDMATMLAVLTTDAVADAATLKAALTAGVADSFNAMTIDGCRSTNDTVLLLASGASGARGTAGNDSGTGNGSSEPTDPDLLAEAVAEACLDLAMQMVGDAEGHTKVVKVRVTGAVSDDEAAKAARKVAESQLVKCSWYGADPYWGRVASDLGTADVALDPANLAIAYGGTVVTRGCVAVAHDEQAVAAHMAGEHLDLHCDLGVGDGSARILTNDLTHAYVDENMGTS
jgi:glutamate N-acetyltransferase/amino-acid N-acetyltransferase